MSLETPWRRGRLDAAAGKQRLLFGRMYEDAEIEREAFRGLDRVFCIASAGCTALDLSDRHEVVACDINPAQIAYSQSRVRGAPRKFGDAERGMAFARVFAPLVGWGSKVVNEFLGMSDVTEQLAFWNAHLDTRRFRFSFDTLLSFTVLSRIYAPQLLSFLPANFGAVLRGRLERGFALHANVSNPYIKALLTGKASANAKSLPLSHIQFELADAASYLESCPAGSFEAFTLSNILDGATPSYRDRLSRAVRRAGSKNAIVVLRSFGEPSPDLGTNYAAQDRAMLWGVVDIREARLF